MQKTCRLNPAAYCKKRKGVMLINQQFENYEEMWIFIFVIFIGRYRSMSGRAIDEFKRHFT